MMEGGGGGAFLNYSSAFGKPKRGPETHVVTAPSVSVVSLVVE